MGAFGAEKYMAHGLMAIAEHGGKLQADTLVEVVERDGSSRQVEFSSLVPPKVLNSSRNHQAMSIALRYAASAEGARAEVHKHCADQAKGGHRLEELGGQSYSAGHEGPHASNLLVATITDDPFIANIERQWLRWEAGLCILHMTPASQTCWPGNRCSSPTFPQGNVPWQMLLGLRPERRRDHRWWTDRRAVGALMFEALDRHGIRFLEPAEVAPLRAWTQGQRTGEPLAALVALLQGVTLASLLDFRAKRRALSSHYPTLHQGNDNGSPGVFADDSGVQALAIGTDQDAFAAAPQELKVVERNGRLHWTPRGRFHAEPASAISERDEQSIPVLPSFSAGGTEVQILIGSGLQVAATGLNTKIPASRARPFTGAKTAPGLYGQIPEEPQDSPPDLKQVQHRVKVLKELVDAQNWPDARNQIRRVAVALGYSPKDIPKWKKD